VFPPDSRILLHRKVDGQRTFNRTWADFRVGFQDQSGNYWIGNERLHNLTARGGYKIRYDVRFKWNTFVFLSSAITFVSFCKVMTRYVAFVCIIADNASSRNSNQDLTSHVFCNASFSDFVNLVDLAKFESNVQAHDTINKCWRLIIMMPAH